MASQSGKSTLLAMMRLLKGTTNYYIPEAMDMFYALPAAHQTGLINFICEQNPHDEWVEMAKDDTLYGDVIRSILFYYTGREDLGQPTKEKLLVMIGQYCTTEAYKDGEANPSSGKEFTTLMGEI